MEKLNKRQISCRVGAEKGEKDLRRAALTLRKA